MNRGARIAISVATGVLALLCCGGLVQAFRIRGEPAPSTVRPTATASSAAPVEPARPVLPPTLSASSRSLSAAPIDIYYRSCAEAKRAGAAPLRRGRPGYRAGLDSDGDGVACER